MLRWAHSPTYKANDKCLQKFHIIFDILVDNYKKVGQIVREFISDNPAYGLVNGENVIDTKIYTYRRGFRFVRQRKPHEIEGEPEPDNKVLVAYENVNGIVKSIEGTNSFILEDLVNYYETQII